VLQIDIPSPWVKATHLRYAGGIGKRQLAEQGHGFEEVDVIESNAAFLAGEQGVVDFIELLRNLGGNAFHRSHNHAPGEQTSFIVLDG
jgi:hypothetical protein